MEWQEIFKQKSFLLQDTPGCLIMEQYQAFVAGRAPTIAVPVIKQIPIVENNEPLIDIKNMHHPRITMLPDHPEGRPFASSDYNAGLPNSSKIRQGVWLRLEKTLAYLDELAPAFGFKPGQVEIKVFEGLRDLATQAKLFAEIVTEIKNNNSLLNDEAVEFEAAKFVSPVKNNIPVHSTGAAVDIRLWNTYTNEFVDMGLFGIIWVQNNAFPLFTENIPTEQKMNRLYFLLAATKAGLIGYIYEHWHFSCGDRYAAYWTENDESRRCAVYGAINE